MLNSNSVVEAIKSIGGHPPATVLTPTGIVSVHGRLRAKNTRIVDADGNAVSLAGNSFFWSHWQGKYYTPEVVGWLKRDWAQHYRFALRFGVTSENGYLQHHPEENIACLTRVIDAAIAEDLYVIIDWHDHEAHLHTAQAAAFFTGIAQRYGHQPHIIYEIFNEPRDVSWAHDVKPYAVQVIAAIRAIDAENLIIVGSPHWSQDVDVAGCQPSQGLCQHCVLTPLLRRHPQAGAAQEGGEGDGAIDLWVSIYRCGAYCLTEWSACNADGNGPIDDVSVKEWMGFMREHQLSHCVWFVSDKKETASIISPGASPLGGWKDADLTEFGRYARKYICNWPCDVSP